MNKTFGVVSANQLARRSEGIRQMPLREDGRVEEFGERPEWLFKGRHRELLRLSNCKILPITNYLTPDPFTFHHPPHIVAGWQRHR